MDERTPFELRQAGRLDWWWAKARQFTLCTETGEQAVSGQCEIHGGDACLAQFARVADLQLVVDGALWASNQDSVPKEDK